MIYTPKRSFQNIILNFGSIFTLIVAAVVLIGWILSYEPVLSLIPDAATMKANTALGFLIVGSIGFLFTKKGAFLNTLVKSLAVLLSVLALLTLLEYIFDISLGIDSLLVEDAFSSVVRNRMSPATASCFLLIGVGVLVFNRNRVKSLMASQFIWLLVIVTAFISIVTYILNIPAEQKTELFSSMAIHTSALFGLMGLGLFFQTSATGFAALLTGPLPGSRITRRLLPFTITVPLALSYLFFYLSVQSTVDIPSSLWVIVNTISLIILSIVYISIMAIDLNKSAKKETSLQQNLKSSIHTLGSFKKAIDKTSIVSELDSQGAITDINENFELLTGYTKDEVVGKPYTSLLELNEEITETILNNLSADGLWVGEVERKAKSGKLWVHSSVVEDKPPGSPTKYFMVEQDISLRKQNEILKDIQFMQKLRQKNKELEQFLYIASHDLQEPLRSIRSMLELLKLELNDKLDEQTTVFMDLVDSSANRMSDLVKGLMDYARLGNQKELEHTDLNKLVTDVLSDIGQSINDHDADIEKSKLPSLDIYPVEIRLLFQNLLSNAIKFRKPDTPPQISISAVEKGLFWQFQIKDNGIGIKEEHQQKIFLIFQRLNKKEEFEGTGIGLAHCMKIISLHGGELWVESNPNEGSSFFFTLPKKQF